MIRSMCKGMRIEGRVMPESEERLQAPHGCVPSAMEE